MPRQQIHHRRRTLEGALASLAPSAPPSQAPLTGDDYDRAQVEVETDLAVEANRLRWRTATDVRDALARIDRGEYGLCVECEEPIGAARLEALPWAARCVSCQAAAEAADDQALSQGAIQ